MTTTQYIPTKEQLEELGFKETGNVWALQFGFNWWDAVRYRDWEFSISLDCSCCSVQFYPESREQVETLLKLFNPK